MDEIFRAEDARFLGPFTAAQGIRRPLVLLGVAAVRWLRRSGNGIQVAMPAR